MSVKAVALLAAGALTLLLGSAADATDSSRESTRKKLRHGQSDEEQWRDQESTGIIIRGKPRRALRWPPRGNFGVGPDSYECIGYDCNW